MRCNINLIYRGMNLINTRCNFNLIYNCEGMDLINTKIKLQSLYVNKIAIVGYHMVMDSQSG